jgi:nicotinate-nucleotide adenylyltransferase
MRVGLLGGSFDPPHLGHIGISKEALEKLNLDQIWWLVTKQNPLKQSSSSNFESRIKLCKKITNAENKILIKDQEKYLKDSYLINLLEEITSNDIENEFFLLIGSDSLINFHKWHRYEDISKLLPIAVFQREGYQSQASQSQSARLLKKDRLIFINNKQYDISSTDLRNKNE